MTSWLLTAAALIPLGWLTHELSHVLAVWATGGRVTAFAPYPHRHSGRWYFARYACHYEAGEPAGARWRHAAPLIKAGLLLPAWALLALLWTPLLFGVAVEVSEVAVWLWGYLLRRPGTDGARFAG